MSALGWVVLLLGVGMVVVIWQLSGIGARLHYIASALHSLDAEVFRLAQEQDPTYGLCSKCGQRGVVRYVVLKNPEKSPSDAELFYCKVCWWMSDSVQVSDEKKYYKDRQSERDQLVARLGPG